MNRPITVSVHSISTLLGTAALAIALIYLGYTPVTAAWFFILAVLNVFSLPLIYVLEYTLPPWMWYLVLLTWVGEWAWAVDISLRDSGGL